MRYDPDSIRFDLNRFGEPAVVENAGAEANAAKLLPLRMRRQAVLVVALSRLNYQRPPGKPPGKATDSSCLSAFFNGGVCKCEC